MFYKISNYFEKTTIKLWLLFLLSSQTIYFIMQAYSIPKISQEAGDILIFDMKPFGYTYDYALKFLSELSVNGYEMYMQVQLPLDILFPILNCLTGLSTFALLIRLYNKVKINSKLTIHSSFSKTVLSLPIIALFSDYLENVLIMIMLFYKTSIPKVLVYIADIFTISKSMSTMLFYIIITLICIACVIAWISNRKKEAINGGKLRGKREKDSSVKGINT